MGKPRILVTGANGFIGRALCQHLLDKGYDVTGIVRSVTKEFADGHYVEAGAIDQERFWNVVKPLLQDIDVVIHLASMIKAESDNKHHGRKMRLVNVDCTRRLIDEAISASVGRFVYLSSISVNGIVTTEHPFTELSETRPGSLYALTKLEAENCIREAAGANNIETVIIRPPMVLGRGVKSNLFSMLSRAIRRGLPLPLAMVNNRRAYVSQSGLVDMLERCAYSREAANQLFLVAEDCVSIREIAVAMAKKAGKRTTMLPVPGFLVRFGGLVTGRQDWACTLLDNLEIDSHKAETMLGWSAVGTKQETLAESVSQMF